MSKLGFAVGIGAAALMLGACASQNSNSVATNQKQKQVAKQQMVCITQPGVGSHIPKTTCMTKAQYQELQKEHQEEMERMKNRPQMQGPSSNGGGPPLRPRI